MRWFRIELIEVTCKNSCSCSNFVEFWVRLHLLHRGCTEMSCFRCPFSEPCNVWGIPTALSWNEEQAMYHHPKVKSKSRRYHLERRLPHIFPQSYQYSADSAQCVKFSISEHLTQIVLCRMRVQPFNTTLSRELNKTRDVAQYKIALYEILISIKFSICRRMKRCRCMTPMLSDSTEYACKTNAYINCRTPDELNKFKRTPNAFFFRRNE